MNAIYKIVVSMFRFSILVSIFLMFGSNAHAETALERLLSDETQRFHEGVTVVFIPGIFGSSLWDQKNGDPLWGKDVYGNKGIGLDVFDKVDAKILLKAEADLIAFRYKTNVYSDALAFLASFPGKVISFPYDWRLSNKVNAKKLDKFLCNSTKKGVLGRRVVFLAHSMGGLVLRHWIKDFLIANEVPGKMECPKTKVENIAKFLFAGTPHFGSPEVISALFTGKSSLTKDFKFRLLYGNEIVKEAITFDSVYELIPPENIVSRKCVPNIDKKITPFSFVRDTGSNGRLDLGNIDTWKRFGLPKIHPSRLSEKQLFEMIHEKIEIAKKTVCSLLTYVVPEEIENRFQFIAGQLVNTKSTLYGAVAHKFPDAGEKAKFAMNYGVGDGTVPLKSATMNEIAIGYSPEANNRVRRVDSNHDALFSDHISKTIVEGVLAAASQRLFIQEIRNLKLKVPEAYFPRVFENLASESPAYYSPEDYLYLVETTTEILNNSGVNANQIYEFARSYKGDNQTSVKALSFSVASDIVGLNGTRNAYANLNAAENLFREGAYTKGAIRADEALKTAPEAQVRYQWDISVKAKSVLGKSLWHDGDKLRGFEFMQDAASQKYRPAVKVIQLWRPAIKALNEG